MEFMALERSHDKDLDSFSSHPRCHELHGEAFSRAAGAEDRHIGIFVDSGIEDIHNNKRVVVLVDAKEYAVVIAHLIACEWVTAGGAQSQNIALGALVKPVLQSGKRERGQESLFLTEGTGLHIHVLRDQQLFHLCAFPFQIVHIISRYGDKKIEIIEVFVVAETIFEKIAAADCAVKVVKVGIGVAGFSDLTAVDAQLLSQFSDHPVFRLAGQKHIHVDAIAGIDNETEPTRWHLCLVSVGRDKQVGVVGAVNADVPTMGEVYRRRGVELIGRNAVNGAACCDILRQYLLDFLGEGVLVAFLATENVEQDLGCGLIFIVRSQHGVAALAKIVCCRSCDCLQRGDGFFLFVATLRAGKWLVFENKEKSACDCFTRAELTNQFQIVFLKQSTMGICFPFQFFPNSLNMTVNVGSLGKNLELHFGWCDLEI